MTARFLGISIVAVLLMLTGAAAAQTFTVTLSGPDSVDVQAGQSGAATIDVTLRGDQFSCVENHDLPVNVTASGQQVQTSVDPAGLTFTGTQGVHDSRTPAGAYNETQQTTVSVSAPSGTSSFSTEVTVTGVFQGGDYGATSQRSCGPNGQFPSAEGTTSFTVNVQGTGGPGDDGATDDDGDNGNGTDGGTGGNMTDGGDDEENGSPLAAWLVPASLLGAALLTRRQQRTS